MITRHDRLAVAVAAASWIVVGLTALARQASPPPAYVLRPVGTTKGQLERGSAVLDTPVLPGSIMKTVTLLAALESQVIEPDTRRVCRRVASVGGRRYACSHPDLHRPLSPAEALAYSCNDFFISLAPRLSRQAFDTARLAVGLPPLGASVLLAPALIGLDGPRVSPRALLDMLIRIASSEVGSGVKMRTDTRAVLREGLAGGAAYGSASAFKQRGLTALVKTGTAPMPGGGALGLVVALEPADRPSRGLVLVAPGAAGLDAAALAADLLVSPPTQAVKPSRPAAPAVTPPPETIRVGVLQAGGRTRVETLALEEGIARVLAGEGQPRAGEAAQDALAVAARTFALANRNRHRVEGYDLCDSTHCQVVRAATPSTRRAAAATAGQVLLHDGAPAFVFYSAWCGGKLAPPSEIRPGALDYGAAASTADDACDKEPGWAAELTARQVERVLRSAGLRGDRLRDLRILTRSASGRAARIRVDGFTPGEIAGHELRMAAGRVIGWQHLKSTSFDIRRTAQGYRFSGRGYGHGAGLCVVGAGLRAAAGESAEQILKFYFPRLTLAPASKASASASAPAPAPAPAVPSASTAAASDDASGSPLRLLLPATEEVDRALVARVVDDARKDIAQRAGVPAPPSLQVTVHPTVESFARATGQPWWIAGATLGTAIDLLPLAVLRQQGQLERTIRHEVAHALVDRALEGRPLWIREGAAFYFSTPNVPRTETRRQPCPTDAELARPVSAGAQRDAYARAEACFRRALEGGKDWREVR